jgi:ketosteroid isomerase-like protein
MTNREIVERLAAALAEDDLEARDPLLADDVVESFPQSGERFRGRENLRAIIENYPNGHPLASSVEVVGRDERWAVTPRYTVVSISGSGEHFTIVARVRYPNDEEWYAVTLVEIRDGKVAELTDFFGAVFDAPDWRTPYREAPR